MNPKLTFHYDGNLKASIFSIFIPDDYIKKTKNYRFKIFKWFITLSFSFLFKKREDKNNVTIEIN